MTQKISLSRGFFATVDDEDFGALSRIKWYAHGHGKWVYARSITHGFMHHHILPKIEGFVTDHINNDSLNNTRANLRYLTQSQNKFNGPAYNINDKKSLFRGVHKTKYGWMARITINQKTLCLGTFKTEKEAARMYNASRLQVVKVGCHA